ncbi:AAA family ATPase [Pseudomonas putida]|uniref:AAA family ATPase n=2 Tax=Pseudomonas putida TaxID=303 RepID=A0A1X0ZRW1_PSEPU|nr:AAA family ATPase [Pseudomonas putida]
MKLSKLTINNWRQFSNIEINFHPQMTIITGANGTGKTTLLKILGQHFGWSLPLLSTPFRKPGSSSFGYRTGVFRHIKKTINPAFPHDNYTQIGELIYSDEGIAGLWVPDNNTPSYNVEIRYLKSLEGLSINSHRPIQNYQAIGAIPTHAISAQQAYQTYHGELIQRYSQGYSQFSPVYRMKETLISMAMFGAGNEYVQKNEPLERIFLDFKEILAQVLPPSIGFKDISVRVPDVVLVTRTGEFMIDAASGGLMSLIDLAWQIFLYSIDRKEFTVLLDEPENHLHPSMQRSLLLSLSKAFPTAQFVVATHSPFMVSSVKESTVHALKYASDSGLVNNPESPKASVTSVELNLDSKAATANEILRDVLGVPVSLPLWAEEDLRRIASELTAESITPEGLTKLRSDLETAGLSEYYPEALKIAVDRQP